MWLHSLFSRSQTGRRPAARKRRGTRLGLEVLENRLAPAVTLLVTGPGDAVAVDGVVTLREALLAANTNMTVNEAVHDSSGGTDSIIFDMAGAFATSQTITLGGTALTITDSVTITGPGAANLAVIGNRQSRIFSISGGATVAIAGLTITEGMAAGDGGGILNNGSALALAGVVLSNNQAVGAAGGNGRGGAVANVSGAVLTVTDCLFTQNQARGGGQGFGGGIFNLASGLTVSRSTFIGNQATGGTGGGAARGGGIDTGNAPDVRITDSAFIGNQAIAGDGSGGNGFGRGGGLYNTAGTVTVENSAFLGNLARGGSNNTRSGPLVGPAAGAGIFNADAGTLILRRSTVIGNQALGGSNNTSTGGAAEIGTAFGGGLNNNGMATITDSLFLYNEARGGSGNRGDGSSSSFEFVGTGTGGGIATSAGNLSGDPVSLTLGNVSLRHNRAVGGDGNTAGTVVDAGIGGGLWNNGRNPFAVSGGSTTTLQDSTVAHNQAVGGHGGAGLGGGVANILGGALNISGSTLAHNRAHGGDGGTAGDGGNGLGGGLYNGAASTHPSNPGAETVLTVEGSAITHNKAQGGAAGVGGSSAGDGLGGGLWNGGTAFLLGTAISHNHALGGDGADGSDGGNGFGGGVYNEATASLRLERSAVTRNHANGGDGDTGGSDGDGIGGGVYNLGDFDLDVLTLIFRNHASTSHDDLFDLLG